MPYEKMPQTNFSPAVKKGLEQLAKDSRLEKRVPKKRLPEKRTKAPKEGVETFSVPTPPTIKLEPQEPRRRPEFQPELPELPELPMQKKKDTMPEWAKNERENMRKDKLVDDEAIAGDKARKEGMGKIGFKNGGKVWAAEKERTTQKNGTVSSEKEQVTFDSEGNYMKKSQSPRGEVTTDFKKLPRIVSGSQLKNGGKVSSASSRADGCAIKGKTRGKMY